MYIVTGGAGFIGSAFVAKLNAEGIKNVVIVDTLGRSQKWQNLVNRTYIDLIHKDLFFNWISEDRVPLQPTAVIHLGACSSTTEQDADYLYTNNYLYTRTLASWALKKGARFIYASSAATYGDGALGFSDEDSITPTLHPLNMYGYSKQLFDQWAMKNSLLHKMAGLKFFNVFGPNEYHKDDMSSVIFKAYNQIKTSGKVQLFKSYKKEYKNGEQLRDFIYVRDCCEVLWWLLQNPSVNGLYNLGTGKARHWNDLSKAVFSAMGLPASIEYIEMPETIRNSYQYHTEAKMEKLLAAGWNKPFTSLEDGATDYIKNYLSKTNPYL